MSWGEVVLERGRVQWPSGMDGPVRAMDAAHWWIERGVTDLVVLDMDGIRGTGQNRHLLGAFSGAGLRVHFGGGLRSMLQVQQVLDAGAAEAVVGTQALLHPEWLRELLLLFPGRIRVHVDIKDGHLVAGAARERLGQGPEQTVARIQAAGSRDVLVTATAGGIEVEPPQPWLDAMGSMRVACRGARGTHHVVGPDGVADAPGAQAR